jgi:hypothetical protein
MPTSRRADQTAKTNRKRRRRADLPPELLEQARRSRLTVANTVKGSVERSAVDAIKYERRAARRGEGQTVREALSHAKPGTLRPRAALYGERDGIPVLLFDAEFSLRDLVRVARHLALVGQLTEGRLSPAAFRARVRSWRPVTVIGPSEIAGQYRFLSDPDAVIALAENARGDEPEWIRYPNAAQRRRRAR